jgi:hypothetical protein
MFFVQPSTHEVGQPVHLIRGMIARSPHEMLCPGALARHSR